MPVPNGGGRRVLMASDGATHGWTVQVGTQTRSYAYTRVGHCTAGEYPPLACD